MRPDTTFRKYTVIRRQYRTRELLNELVPVAIKTSLILTLTKQGVFDGL